MVTLGRLNNFANLDQQQAFVERLKTGNGLYRPSADEEVLEELAVQVYGHAIANLTIGGSKRDSHP